MLVLVVGVGVGGGIGVGVGSGVAVGAGADIRIGVGETNGKAIRWTMLQHRRQVVDIIITQHVGAHGWF